MNAVRNPRKSFHENLRDSQVLAYETQARLLEFMLTDVDIALSFAEIALQAHAQPEKRNRNTETARKGFDTIIHFKARLDRTRVNPADINELERKLTRLRSKLEALGQT